MRRPRLPSVRVRSRLRSVRVRPRLRSARVRPRLRSVRVRITVGAVAVTAVAVVVAGWWLIRSVEDNQLSQIRAEIDDQLDSVASRLAAGEDPQAVLDSLSPVSPVRIYDESGRSVAELPVVVQPEGGGPTPRAFEPDPERAAAPDSDTRLEVERLTRQVATPSGDLTVQAEAQVDDVARSVAALRRALVVGLPALVLAVAVAAWVLVGRALRPVEAIRAEVDAITGTTMHRRVPEPPTGDEIERLAHTMNAMLGRLDVAATRQKQFVADASHELRSPVAAIRTGLEVARGKPDADWPTVADKALANEARLERLLDDLLLLAAHDEIGVAAAPPGGPVDLASLTRTEADRRARRVPVRVTATATPIVHGSSDQLARVVVNLLDNAARHAVSVVEATVSSPAGHARLTIDDDGPGIPEPDRTRVFDRFTRLDNSRTRDRGGAGLGLAVVRSITTRHQGHVHATTSPLGGTRIVVDLPLPARAPCDSL